MPANYVLAIDIGSSNVHCLIVNLAGQVISFCHEEWTYDSPSDIAPLGKEFDPNKLWRIVCKGIRRSIKDAGISSREIVGISATSQREGMVLLDKAGEALYAGPNIDLRALMEGLSIDGEFKEEIYAITGHTPSFLFAPAKLKWFESNRPETWRKIDTVLTISEWIIFKLCGERVSEVSGASELGLIDLKERTWSDKLRELLHLPQGIYPELLRAGSLAGRITPQSAAETDILQGTPVSLGAPDTQCGLIGMNIKDPGQTGIVIGWSAPVQTVTDIPILDPDARIWTGCHILERWLLESNAGEAGNAYHWLKEIMFSHGPSKSEGEIYQLMDHLARQSPAGSDGVLSFIGPTAMDMSHLGLRYGGILFPVPLSANIINKGHLIRAALENLCFAIKANCHQLERVLGYKIKGITIGGGMARSLFLAEMLPSVLDLPVSVPEITDVSGLGAAMCAAAGSGAYSTLEEAIEAMKPGYRTFQPDRSLALEYDDYYRRWSSAAESLLKLSEEM